LVSFEVRRNLAVAVLGRRLRGLWKNFPIPGQLHFFPRHDPHHLGWSEALTDHAIGDVWKSLGKPKTLELSYGKVAPSSSTQSASSTTSGKPASISSYSHNHETSGEAESSGGMNNLPAARDPSRFGYNPSSDSADSGAQPQDVPPRMTTTPIPATPPVVDAMLLDATTRISTPSGSPSSKRETSYAPLSAQHQQSQDQRNYDSHHDHSRDPSESVASSYEQAGSVHAELLHPTISRPTSMPTIQTKPGRRAATVAVFGLDQDPTELPEVNHSVFDLSFGSSTKPNTSDMKTSKPSSSGLQLDAAAAFLETLYSATPDNRGSKSSYPTATERQSKGMGELGLSQSGSSGGHPIEKMLVTASQRRPIVPQFKQFDLGAALGNHDVSVTGVTGLSSRLATVSPTHSVESNPDSQPPADTPAEGSSAGNVETTIPVNSTGIISFDTIEGIAEPLGKVSNTSNVTNREPVTGLESDKSAMFASSADSAHIPRSPEQKKAVKQPQGFLKPFIALTDQDSVLERTRGFASPKRRQRNGGRKDSAINFDTIALLLGEQPNGVHHAEPATGDAQQKSRKQTLAKTKGYVATAVSTAGDLARSSTSNAGQPHRSPFDAIHVSGSSLPPDVDSQTILQPNISSFDYAIDLASISGVSAQPASAHGGRHPLLRHLPQSGGSPSQQVQQDHAAQQGSSPVSQNDKERLSMSDCSQSHDEVPSAVSPTLVSTNVTTSSPPDMEPVSIGVMSRNSSPSASPLSKVGTTSSTSSETKAKVDPLVTRAPAMLLRNFSNVPVKTPGSGSSSSLRGVSHPKNPFLLSPTQSSLGSDSGLQGLHASSSRSLIPIINKANPSNTVRSRGPSRAATPNMSPNTSPAKTPSIPTLSPIATKPSSSVAAHRLGLPKPSPDLTKASPQAAAVSPQKQGADLLTTSQQLGRSNDQNATPVVTPLPTPSPTQESPAATATPDSHLSQSQESVSSSTATDTREMSAIKRRSLIIRQGNTAQLLAEAAAASSRSFPGYFERSPFLVKVTLEPSSPAKTGSPRSTQMFTSPPLASSSSRQSKSITPANTKAVLEKALAAAASATSARQSSASRAEQSGSKAHTSRRAKEEQGHFQRDDQGTQTPDSATVPNQQTPGPRRRSAKQNQQEDPLSSPNSDASTGKSGPRKRSSISTTATGTATNLTPQHRSGREGGSTPTDFVPTMSMFFSQVSGRGLNRSGGSARTSIDRDAMANENDLASKKVADSAATTQFVKIGQSSATTNMSSPSERRGRLSVPTLEDDDNEKEDDDGEDEPDVETDNDCLNHAPDESKLSTTTARTRKVRGSQLGSKRANRATQKLGSIVEFKASEEDWGLIWDERMGEGSYPSGFLPWEASSKPQPSPSDLARTIIEGELQRTMASESEGDLALQDKGDDQQSTRVVHVAISKFSESSESPVSHGFATPQQNSWDAAKAYAPSSPFYLIDAARPPRAERPEPAERGSKRVQLSTVFRE